MTNATDPVVTIRPGLLERLKTNSGIRSDEAFARMIGVSRSSYARLKAGEEPTLRAIIGIAQAFGLGLSEVVLVTEPKHEEIDADVVDRVAS